MRFVSGQVLFGLDGTARAGAPAQRALSRGLFASPFRLANFVLGQRLDWLAKARNDGAWQAPVDVACDAPSHRTTGFTNCAFARSGIAAYQRYAVACKARSGI